MSKNKPSKSKLREIAAVLGAAGGAAKSPAKAKAARENARQPRPGRQKIQPSVSKTKKS